MKMESSREKKEYEGTNMFRPWLVILAVDGNKGKWTSFHPSLVSWRPRRYEPRDEKICLSISPVFKD